jgi:hypothetical protein
MLEVCRMLEARGRELDELNDLVGRTSKFGENGQPSIRGIR